MQTHHKASNAADAENTSNIVDALENMGGSILCSKTRRVMVAEHTKEQTDEVPDADQNAVVAPVTRFSNELSVQY